MATADDYAKWIVANANKKGTADFDTVTKAYQEAKASEVATPQGYDFGKTISSAPGSLYENTVGGLVNMVSSPLQTGQALSDIVAGGIYNALPGPMQRGLTAIEQSPYNPLGDPASLQRAQNVASAVGQDYATTYGTRAGFRKMMEEDPFRVVGDVSTVLGGSGAALRAGNIGGRSNAIANAMVRGGELTNPINMLARPAAAMVSPTVDPNVRALMAEGVTPTIGQILGGGYKRFEEGLTSIPVIGDYIKSAQGRAVEQLSTAAFNRALKPIGSSLPSGTTGREAVQFVSDKFVKLYGFRKEFKFRVITRHAAFGELMV